MSNVTPEMTDELTYCYKHPNREATLRCIRCDRYICTECLVRAPTGYICKDCARRADDKFFHGTQNDLIMHGAVCFVVMALAAGLIWYSRIAAGNILFALFLGPFVGGAVAELALRVTQRRRARHSDLVGAAAAAAGGALGAVIVAFIYISTLMNGSLPNNYSTMQAMQTIQDAGQAVQNGALSWALQAVFLNISYMIFLGLAVAGVYGRFQVRI